jgi:hypothetical protein
MQSAKSNILFFSIGAILMWLLLKQCSPTYKPIAKYIPGDSIPYTVYEGVPAPYAVHYTDTIPLYDTIWQQGDTQYVLQPIDTMLILMDYYAKVNYIDTVKNDSSALIVLNETIFKNRISDRVVTFQNRRPTAIIQERTKAIVLGVGGTVIGLDASVGYRQNRNIFNLTYSSQGLGFRYQREIGWRKASEK